jgi:dephospho-CoA kinase
LFEARYDDLFDEVLIVDCDENNIIERLMKRDNISVELAKQKIASQLSTEEKIAYANKNKVKYYLLENKGSILELYTSIDKYLDTLK